MAKGQKVNSSGAATGGVMNTIGSSDAAHADAELLRVAHTVGEKDDGTPVLRVMGDGRLVLTGKIATAGLGASNSAAGTTPGNVVKKLQVFDEIGASLGYLAIYDAIT